MTGTAAPTALLADEGWFKFPLFERLLLSIWEKEVAVGPGMIGIEPTGYTAAGEPACAVPLCGPLLAG